MIILWGLACLALLSIVDLMFSSRQLSAVVSALSVGIFYFVVSASYFNGVDWVSYKNLFYDAIGDAKLIWEYEPGFVMIFSSLSKLTLDFRYVVWGYFAVISLVLLSGAFILKVSTALTSFLFLSFYYFDIFTDQIRQAGALCFMFLSVAFFYRKKYWFGIFAAFVSVVFHYSLVVFVLVSLVVLKIAPKKMVPVVLVGALFFWFLIDNIGDVLTLLPGDMAGLRLAGNLYNEAKAAEPRVGGMIIFDLFFIVLFLFSGAKDDLFYRLKALIFASSCLHIVFYSFPLLQRITLSFYVFHILFLLFFVKMYLSPRGYANKFVRGRRVSMMVYSLICLLFSLSVLTKGLLNPIRANYICEPYVFESRN